jgi:hypothetical protein
VLAHTMSKHPADNFPCSMRRVVTAGGLSYGELHLLFWHGAGDLGDLGWDRGDLGNLQVPKVSVPTSYVPPTFTPLVLTFGITLG